MKAQVDSRAQEELLYLEMSRNNLNKKKSKTWACMQINQRILYLRNNVFLFQLLLIVLASIFLRKMVRHINSQKLRGVMLEVLEEKV